MRENLSREFSRSEEILFCDKFVITFAKVDERDSCSSNDVAQRASRDLCRS